MTADMGMSQIVVVNMAVVVVGTSAVSSWMVGMRGRVVVVVRMRRRTVNSTICTIVRQRWMMSAVVYRSVLVARMPHGMVVRRSRWVLLMRF